jgi:hypothetical protein
MRNGDYRGAVKGMDRGFGLQPPHPSPRLDGPGRRRPRLPVCRGFVSIAAGNRHGVCTPCGSLGNPASKRPRELRPRTARGSNGLRLFSPNGITSNCGVGPRRGIVMIGDYYKEWPRTARETDRSRNGVAVLFIQTGRTKICIPFSSLRTTQRGRSGRSSF